MEIHIEIVSHDDQRYDTVGDWTFNSAFQEGNLFITVSDMNNWRYESLVGIHEAIEAILCDYRGIAEEDVTSFDKKFKGKGEPGDAKDAPYRKEHKFATKIEKMLAKELGVDWKKYSQAVDNL